MSAAEASGQSCDLVRAYSLSVLVTKGQQRGFWASVVGGRNQDEATGAAMQLLQQEYPGWTMGEPNLFEITPEAIVGMGVETLVPAVPINKEEVA